ncbi:PepSY domain-containing protein [Capnocytophaga sp.]|uniref:PepSY domain-containing protein n=1 Tax=Capnocytophaga sp. TaxID=44737 RepID=UPI0026DAAF6C|nr:PepSY domain-containing protein [Capnocytophaga sp.]MDO5104428.1 PepSY domain-containing protein [Capnocytophaga sp.]
MTISVWRYAHLALSLLASVFILMASVTGIILAIEPVSQQFRPLKSDSFNEITLGETIAVLQAKYTEVLTLEVDENDFVKAEVVDNKGYNTVFYVNPKSGEKLGAVSKRSEIFTFSQTLHRSLFMGKVGRVLMAITSFLLLLIAFSGMLLIVRKQKHWKNFFRPLVKENSFPYYHSVLGRLILFPILIISFTGIYLSLEGFSFFSEKELLYTIDNELLLEEPRKKIVDFEVFDIPLSGVRKVEFPLFEDVEEFFTVETTDKKLVVNQLTGEVLHRVDFSVFKLITHYSSVLHTGRGAWLWSIILGLSAIGILFFMYSGFSIALSRRKSVIKNRFKKEECDYVILVGSEGGTTISFANMLYNELVRQKIKVFLAEMNAFETYPNMKHLVVMTSTYGQGEAPVNALKFNDLCAKIFVPHSFSYAVLGFGSLAYPDFCKYAYDVDALLRLSPNATQLMEVHTVNNQSFESFSAWVNTWASHHGFNLQLAADLLPLKKRKQYTFTVVKKTEIQCDETFLIWLQPDENVRFSSGDLLGITSNEDKRERLYSIGKVKDNQILLSVKRHCKGLISNFLNELKEGDALQAGIEKNPKFHFPKKANQVVCIATGTGITPFLGMIQANEQKRNVRLIWGGKTEKSFELYSPFVYRFLEDKQLTDLQLAFSREGAKRYVQDVVKQQAVFFTKLLAGGGVVMLCGSVAMQKSVVETLDFFSRKHLQKPLSFFQNKGQILMDCY